MLRLRGGYLLFLPVLAGLTAIFMFFSCSPSKSDTNSLEVSVVKGYTDIAYATYNDALLSAQKLKRQVSYLLDNPSEQTLLGAQKAWITARMYYGQTEVFRFYDGPIDNGTTGVEGLLNAWPLDEIYVDYVEGNAAAGIINDIENYPSITRDLLVGLNEKGGEENISCGYHAIEFMLWGQDVHADSPGKRPFTDFIAGSAYTDRRRIYLQLTTELLIKHLTQLVDAWKPSVQNNYAAYFLKLEPKNALQKIITGMGVLSKVEMAGERMFTAYDNASQEDEQSCFSDNTKADLMNNLGGIINIFYGTYVRFDKTNLQVPALDDLLKITDEKLYITTNDLLKKCNSEIQNIYQPFDIAIVEEDKRAQVMRAILSVQQVGEQMAEIATTLGLVINVNSSD